MCKFSVFLKVGDLKSLCVVVEFVNDWDIMRCLDLNHLSRIGQTGMRHPVVTNLIQTYLLCEEHILNSRIFH